MWYRAHVSRADPDFVSSASDLLRATTRKLIFITGGAFLGWYYLGTEALAPKLVVQFFPLSLVVAVVFGVALWLLRRRLVAAQILWQVGLAVTIVLAAVIGQQPAIMVSLALLPLAAVLTLGWPAGLLAEGAVALLVWWGQRNPLVPALPAGFPTATILGGALAGTLGWAATQSLLTVTEWSLFSYEQARQKMEEARDQHAELQQVKNDLVHANRELTRLSDRLRLMYQVADEARQAKAEFVANVSHELRTPLNMIIGFSQLITQSPEIYGEGLPAPLLADITAIQRNSQHLARLVDDVLDLSQVDAGRMALNREWVAVGEIVTGALQGVRALFESKGLYLEAEIEADLPALFCDATRIRQVVINLLSNAGRFTERGGVRVRVWREGDQVVTSVADTGPGIAPGDQERLFEPFQQLDGSIRRRYGGSGLGLSISKRFVEMHGGRMGLESEVGVGTRIWFSLPLTGPPPAASGGDDALRWFSPYSEYEYRARTQRSKAPLAAPAPRYVVLERGEALRRLLERYVDGAEVVAALDAERARGELERSPAQALLMNLPPSDGDNLLPKLASSLPYGTPAMACWVPGEGEAARRLGVWRYLVKPVTREALRAGLESLGGTIKQVLLVDDEQEVLRLFTRMLASSDGATDGYRVLWASSGPQALEMMRQRHPDAVLLDLIMPGMDGFQVLQEKSRDPAIRDIPVLIVSSRDPVGEPIVSDTLTVSRAGGLSARDLLACIQAISRALLPAAERDPAPRGTPGG